MRNHLLIACFALFSIAAYSQTTVAFHQSNLPFVGVNHQFGEKFIPELRIGTDQYFEDLSAEIAANYMLKRTDRYEFYAGVGGRVGNFSGVVVPVGLNIYPFEQKDFGFQMEAAGIVGESSILRGSFGIRYRFSKD
ncbi:hypothetical protein J0A68_02395 [Algoriphagus sp. H41]|uniref:Outer membrane insertion C-signal n=1 Tax=Algoriphagus oliviformis TaxID=2811231 RepID=A0ABS3BYQ0_9BACT|nr:hypothetical protein [Algoriphagus oliviformis]MBN7809790.1 hypothetical protein [Algoriphagus oliviformis]